MATSSSAGAGRAPRLLDQQGVLGKNRDLCVQYQPKVDLQSGPVVGVAALVRWDHRKHGLMLPEHLSPAVQ